MDNFLLRFERYAEAQNWDEENLAINLSALLRGYSFRCVCNNAQNGRFKLSEFEDSFAKTF